MPDVPKPEDLGTYVADLERRIKILESAPKLQDSSVTNGTLTVKDASAVIKTQFGFLSDGTYGLAVRTPGDALVNVNNTLFPVIASSSPTQNVTTTSFQLLPSGPSVNATIGESGRALVTATSDVGLANTAMTAYLGFRVAGADRGSGFLSVSSTVTVAASLGRPVLVTGLAAGVTTFACIARVTSGTGQFSNTTLIVQPF